MTTISILYPKSARFDLPYYLDKHMPLAIELLGSQPGFQGVTVEHGLSGAMPGSAAAYAVICRFQFDSVENFMAAFLPHAAALQGDIPNYTDGAPIIQVNELLLSR